MAEEAFLAVKTVSIETAPGRHSSMRRAAPANRKSSFSASVIAAGGRHTPNPSSRRRPFSKQTTP